MSTRKGPVLIELEEAPGAGPEAAAPVPDLGAPAGAAADGRAMQVVATLGAKRPSRLARFFWAALLGLVGFVASLAAWNFVTRLLAAEPVLGWIAFGLVAAVLLALVLIALRELAAFARLGRLDRVHQAAEAALAEGDLGRARQVTGQIAALYAGRPELRLGREALERQREELFDAASLFALAEAEVMVPLDRAAAAQIEAAARQVATVTALVPLALADVIVALTANLRMIRRIAEIYGGRAGTLGSWRLTRAVMTHLVATGAVAIGDDLLGSALGGSVLSKLSRRFGEGVVNGALTARVGLAAMEVCRPLPFGEGRRPSVTGLIRRALTGLVGRSEG
ncbi:YcjF family protein [Gymnodinialimonas ceratoperidinii]|uniref:YcjF family protein n=1 Tax=Gymnodinialimonas ceratoperidinii TaxID=2856823 RepID=A0A8F6TZ60_9RHOB|nr:TIGR01620 family protein [Gymnodinialimonas ceratoperidinii]QXT40679.1 YcjF family protein [Gymnodinialimonas ceratoperidinii]